MALTFPATLEAQFEPGEARLIANSPFLPPGFNDPKPEPLAPPPPPPGSGPIARELEFRGVVQIGGQYRFSIFNKSDQKSFWVPENQSESGISVRNYDANSMSLTVTYKGRSEKISLMSASDNPMPVAASLPSAPPPSGPPVPNLPQVRQTQSSGEQPARAIPRRRVILPRSQ